jgi:hypothetical protein
MNLPTPDQIDSWNGHGQTNYVSKVLTNLAAEIRVQRPGGREGAIRWLRKYSDIVSHGALDLSKKKGMHRVSLQVVRDNTRAVHLYEKMGFALEGILKDSYFGVDGCYHDMLQMAKIFD